MVLIMDFLHKLKVLIINIVDNIRFFGLCLIFKFIIKPKIYKLKGEHYREINVIIRPGDVLLREDYNRIGRWLIKVFWNKGFWNHAGIYIGNNNVVHAVSEGVLIEDIINFMRTDHLVVLRAEDSKYASISVENVNKIIGAEYDFAFNFTNSRRFSCTEVIDYCYPGILTRKKLFGKSVIFPDDILNNENFSIIWNSRNSLIN